MASDTRAKMVEGAARLLAERGLQETSFSEVLELTGAPRGSIYHHFPQGKDQLVGEAIDLAGARAIQLLERKAGASALEVTEFFVYIWHEVLARSRFRAGCSVLAVTVATDSPALMQRAAAVFQAWQEHLARLLEQGGLRRDDADGFAATLIASMEGAVVVSRALKTMDVFDQVGRQLVAQAAALSAAAPG